MLLYYEIDCKGTVSSLGRNKKALDKRNKNPISGTTRRLNTTFPLSLRI